MQANHVRVRGGRALRGRVRLPIDLDVAQRALLFAALAEGRSQLQVGAEIGSLAAALNMWRALGVRAELDSGVATVEGVGLSGLRMPSGALDCERSFATLALFAGTLSGQRFGTRLTVHESLAERSVEHIVGPLRARGAHIAGRAHGPGIAAPIAVAPLIEPEQLLGLDAALPWSDAEAKSAALISGLFAAGPTTISEPSVSADHTERLMVGLGLPLRRIGSVVAFDPSDWDRRIPALGAIALPGSATLAACFAVTAQLVAGSDITLLDVGRNPTRNGVLDIVRMWGAALAVEDHGDAALREPIGDVRVQSAALRGGVIDGELLVRARDELPLLALLGAVAQRGARIYDLAWLGAEADPQCSALAELFQAFGLSVVRSAGELRVGANNATARATLHAARVDALHDPRISLAACALGLACPGETVVEHAAQALRAVYPGFIETAQALGADIEFA